MNERAALVWFRNDLRVSDNAALAAAAARGTPVCPAFIWAPDDEIPWAPGAASRWWLHASLEAHAARLSSLGAPLVIRSGPTREALATLANRTGARVIYANRRYEPRLARLDDEIGRALAAEGIELRLSAGVTLFEPGAIKTASGEPYKVFTPFSRACGRSLDALGEPLRAPSRLEGCKRPPRGLAVEALGLLPDSDWTDGMRDAWTPGEEGARRALERATRSRVKEYEGGRDMLAESATSMLSPHLHFGEISVRRAYTAVERRLDSDDRHERRGAEQLLRQLLWREFANHLLAAFEHLPDEPMNESFSAFPWRRADAALRAWQRGRTGYPIVDAGMRQLWVTGWMHNRARMIAASFLTKHLLISWRQGAAWFWDTLVDADLANNTLGWQWVTGCGPDAAPYFRIFNPVLQGEKFDPRGDYVRRWVPELAELPTKWIHKPWAAPAPSLFERGVRLGEDYPEPIVDHAEARARALAAYQKTRERALAAHAKTRQRG
jgi:deoxyribodipyrimidine photo-lyase